MKSNPNTAVLAATLILLASGIAFGAWMIKSDSGNQTTQSALFQGHIPANKLVGMTVQNQDGKAIGKVSAQKLDENGKTRFLAISTTGTKGSGEKKILVPAGVFKPNSKENALILTVDEHLLADAPQKTSNMSKAGFDKELYEHYGLAPYWEQAKPFNPGPQDSY